MTYKELQEYLVDKYGHDVEINGNITALYNEAQYDINITKYIGFMNSLITDNDELYKMITEDESLNNLDIYKVDKVLSTEGNLDALYNNGLLWANNIGSDENYYAWMIDGYKFDWYKCRLGRDNVSE